MKPSIDLSCTVCGGNRIAIPAEGRDDSAVLCQDCGHRLGSLGELKAKVERAVLRRRNR